MTHNDRFRLMFEEFSADTSDEAQTEERQKYAEHMIRTRALQRIMNAIMVGEYGDAYTSASDLHQYEKELEERYLNE